MEDFVRWIIDIVVGILLGLMGWFHTLLTGVDKRLALVEARPVVDPIRYAEAMSAVVHGLETLTERFTEHSELRKRQHEELCKAHQNMQRKLDELASKM